MLKTTYLLNDGLINDNTVVNATLTQSLQPS